MITIPWLAFLSLVLTHWSSLTNAVCFDDIEEHHQCSGPPVITTVDEAWYQNVTTWYIPMWNQVEVYENAQLIFGHEGLHDLSPQDLDRSCAYYREAVPQRKNASLNTFKWNSNKNAALQTKTSLPLTETWYSFNRSVEFQIHPDPIRPGVLHYSTPNKNINFTQEFVATSYLTLTDNASFLVTVCYWVDGRKGFVVSSPFKVLGPQEKSLIREHVIQLGFRSQYFVYTDYSKC